MHHFAPTGLLILAGAALLAFAALHDIGFRTVPNRVSAALLMLGLVLRVLQGDVLGGLLCGGVVFGCTYAFWRFGWMGGADVKLLTAAAVFVPPLLVPTLVIGTSLAGGVLALIYLAASMVAPKAGQPRPAKARPAETLPAGEGVPKAGLVRRALRCEMRRLRRRGPLPYAAAIATGSWLAIAAS